MATVDGKFAANIIAHDGWYQGDKDNSLGDNPRCIIIVRYINAWGAEAYGVTFEGERDPLRYCIESEYVRNPRIIWRADNKNAEGG